MGSSIREFFSVGIFDSVKKRIKIPSGFRRDSLIFVHVPKAAGSTIVLSLLGYRVGHRAISGYWHADREFTEKAFKFSFVRHPYFRFLSAYNFLKAGGINHGDEQKVRDNRQAFSSLAALAEACEEKTFRDRLVHLRPQWYFLSFPETRRYKVFMNYVGKTEFFNQDINVLRDLLPAEVSGRLCRAKRRRINASSSAPQSLNRDVFSKIRRIYEDDFEIFGYDQWGTVERAYYLNSRAFR